MSQFEKWREGVEERLKIATPGPWKTERRDYAGFIVEVNESEHTWAGYPESYIAEMGGWGYGGGKNGELVANAPTDLRIALDVIEAYKQWRNTSLGSHPLGLRLDAIVAKHTQRGEG